MVKASNYIKSLLRLVRWENLVIIAITQILIRQCVIIPILGKANMEAQLTLPFFILLVLSTVFISAGGYAINDYFDRKIDRINKPKEMIVGSIIYPRHAMAYHMLFTVFGVIFGVWISIHIGQIYLSLIFFMISGLLWFYSTVYKGEFLLGNFIVALLTGFVPFIVLLFELPLLADEYGSSASYITQYLITWVSGFSFFAFLINLIREIIKDCEDFEGDKAFGKKTIPVIWGIKWARFISIGLINITIALLILSWLFFIHDIFTLFYFLIIMIVPLILLEIKLFKDGDQFRYHGISKWLKIIMLMGLVYMIISNLIIF